MSAIKPQPGMNEIQKLLGCDRQCCYCNEEALGKDISCCVHPYPSSIRTDSTKSPGEQCLKRREVCQ